MTKTLVVLFMAAFLLYGAVSGIIRGSAPLFYSSVKRSEDPLMFWVAVIMSAGGAIVLLVFYFF